VHIFAYAEGGDGGSGASHSGEGSDGPGGIGGDGTGGSAVILSRGRPVTIGHLDADASGTAGFGGVDGNVDASNAAHGVGTGGYFTIGSTARFQFTPTSYGALTINSVTADVSGYGPEGGSAPSSVAGVFWINTRSGDLEITNGAQINDYGTNPNPPSHQLV